MPENRPVTEEDLGKLHDREVALLWLIRSKYRFGELKIVVRDGIPDHLTQTVERIGLTNIVVPS